MGSLEDTPEKVPADKRQIIKGNPMTDDNNDKATDAEDKKPQAEEARDEMKEHVKDQMEDFKKSHVRDFLFFDNMLTPKIITLVYWLLIIGSVFSGIAAIFTGQLIYGVGIIVFGIVGSRIYCELMIVLFKMNEALQDIRKK